MKHLKKFNNESDYQTFLNGEDYVEPNVCVIDSTSPPSLIFKKKGNTFNFPITLTKGTTTQEAANLYTYMVEKYNLGNDVVKTCELGADEEIFINMWGNDESSIYFAWNINGIGGNYASTQNPLAFLRGPGNYDKFNSTGLAINSSGSVEWFSYEVI